MVKDASATKQTTDNTTQNSEKPTKFESNTTINSPLSHKPRRPANRQQDNDTETSKTKNYRTRHAERNKNRPANESTHQNNYWNQQRFRQVIGSKTRQSKPPFLWKTNILRENKQQTSHKPKHNSHDQELGQSVIMKFRYVMEQADMTLDKQQDSGKGSIKNKQTVATGNERQKTYTRPSLHTTNSTNNKIRARQQSKTKLTEHTQTNNT